MNEGLKTMLIWGFVILVMLVVFGNFSDHTYHNQPISYSAFIDEVKSGGVNAVDIFASDGKITGQYKGKDFTTYMPMTDDALLPLLINNSVDVTGNPPQQPSLMTHLLINWLPFLIIIGVWFFFMRQMQGGGRGGGNPLTFGRSRARVTAGDKVKVRFKDVAGITEAKREVQELVEFLKDPKKFIKIGGRIPKGALLVGPPGTGKTLLAKAVAGEAGVPFFTISGSDFVEMFVGVGASRVRDMFEQARKHSPCIIFIDELDAVGRARGAGLGGGHDEREQTLNQLLVEMDGFEGKEGVIVMAATNRPDVLDKALLRPGRFDRQVVVPLPDIRGREEILDVHAGRVTTDNDVDTSVIARGTPGFSGAELANLVNEAALAAAREDCKKVSQRHLDSAKDRIMMGSERSSMVMNDQEKRLTAYHEAGHAIVGWVLAPDHDPVYKVTIIPRGMALGVTMFLPEEDKYSYSLAMLESKLCSMYGGRIAEELIFGADQVTTGASNDIERATEIARNLVTRWGLSSLGPIAYGEEESEVFLGKSMTTHKDHSEETAKLIDQEIKKIVDRNYQRATKILKDHMEQLHAMAEALIEHESIDTEQITAIMEKPVKKPKRTRKTTKKAE